MTSGNCQHHREILHAVYSKSVWALHKFKWLDRGVKCTILAVCVLFLGGILAILR